MPNKTDKLAEIVADANELKESDTTVTDARRAEMEALADLTEARTQYDIDDVELPSERVPFDDGDGSETTDSE
jgi:hypothetical protein